MAGLTPPSGFPKGGDLGFGPARGYIGPHGKMTKPPWGEKGHKVPKLTDEQRARVQKAEDTLAALLDDETPMVRHNASVSLRNQLLGMPTQRIESTGADGAPIEVAVAGEVSNAVSDIILKRLQAAQPADEKE